MAIDSVMSLYPSNPFLMSSSFASEDSEIDDNQFNFTISDELLIDPKDVEISDIIGRGRNSFVCKGLYKNQVPVAVKLGPTIRTSAGSKHYKEMFQNEVIFLSKIKHDNIVKFVGAIIEPVLVIVTELLEGGSLKNLLWGSLPKTLDLKMSLSYALDIARAMECLHSNGFIYRDLRPKNVLLTSDLTHAKLSDFGLTREETTGCMTTKAGTYRWMAPEVFFCVYLQVINRERYDHKVDVYSFAIVLWELLTKKLPFSGLFDINVAYLVVSKNKRPSLCDIPDDVASILESCWAKDPKARPEFKEITVLLSNLLTTLCSDNNCGFGEQSDLESVCSDNSSNRTMINHPALNEEDYDGDDDMEDECSTSTLIQMRNSQETKPMKKMGEVKKRVMKLISPFFKMFKHCLSKP
ncbi:unnamed protein product [Eruca vesicaria subsp. sativa]|uniref:Protein kinase domain-containing protein n=1 Tax=Eruca vesicaria subsp. sativa TaxID=29727 RepID=A0ABC8JZL1_ERUVS|nr:unnamed protein product [Eruca vesicaria subsp. sativa]